MGQVYRDRQDAGRQLAAALVRFAPWQRPLVLGLPRGGVPIASEVARALGAEVDAVVVRKLGAPGHEELAIGAVVAGGVEVLNAEIIESLGIAPASIEAIARREHATVALRERALRGGRPALDVAGRDVILVDDGIATGATMRAAAQVVAARHPARLIVAVPVGPPGAEAGFRTAIDAVLILRQPPGFAAVGEAYDDFRAVSDAEVVALLNPPVA